MKPFDLEKALAGEPVVTRDGKPVSHITKFPAKNSRWQLCAVVDGFIEPFSEDGMHIFLRPQDLFMVENPKVKKEGWINVYKHKSLELIAECGGGVYCNEEKAKKSAASTCIATVKIEWEEDAE